MGISAISFNPAVGRTPVTKLKKVKQAKKTSNSNKKNESIFKNSKMSKQNKMSLSEMASAIKKSDFSQAGAASTHSPNNIQDFFKYFRKTV